MNTIQKNKILNEKKILIAGDDVNFINTLEKTFYNTGAEVLVSHEIKQVTSALESEELDIILFEVDKNFSNLSKIEALDIIQVSNKKGLPLILITDDEGSGMDDRYNADNIISKSDLNLVELVSAMETALVIKLGKTPDTVIDISEEELTDINSDDCKDTRVMVVEDDPLLRSLLSVRLVKSGIDYQFCHSGEEVIEKIKEYKPTVIVLDLMLPGKDGLDVLQDIRNEPGYETVSVVVFSNKDNDIDRQRAKELGVEHFLIKAMTDLNVLLKIITTKTT